MTLPLCPICSTPGRACGDDHITAPVITSDTIKGVNTVAQLPQELKEYEYYVGHALITAQLTEDQAERMGAKAPGTSVAPKVGETDNKTAEQTNSNMAKADEHGAAGDDPEALNKARRTRNQRAR